MFVVSSLMKKWRNLRDTFKRQLEAEKKIREGHEIKKKTYVYFKHMLYLLPHIITPETSDPSVEPKLDEFFTSQAKTKRKSSDKSRSQKKKKRHEKRALLNSLVIPDLPTTSVSNKDELIDEDKHFLMSLVPSFKRMSDDEKLEAKVEILKTIKTIRKKSLGSNECNLADSLTCNLEDTDLNEVKVEMITVEDYADESDRSISGDNETPEQINSL